MIRLPTKTRPTSRRPSLVSVASQVPNGNIWARAISLTLVGVGAFAVSYLLFSRGPAAVEGPRGGDPPGMVWVPGGTFSRGSDKPRMRDARPVHRVAVDGFWMDRTAVTNEQFVRGDVS